MSTPFLDGQRLRTRAVTLAAALVLGVGTTVAGSVGGLPPAVPPTEAVPAAALPSDEAALVSALANLRDGRLDDALAVLAALVESSPDSRVAQLMYGDLLSAKYRMLAGLGDVVGARGARPTALYDEARSRLRHAARLPPPGHLPGNLLKLGPGQTHAIVVDVSASRMYVFERADGRLQLVRDRYVSTGRNGAPKRLEGDQRTPVGVYFTVGRLPATELADFYGPAALPVTYPNDWDDRHGRTGYGIWLHGVPGGTSVRPPRASDGCLVVSNPDMRDLVELIESVGTPVVIAERVRWEAPEEVERRAAEIEAAISAWSSDWAHVAHQAYSDHYHAPDQRVDALVRSLSQDTREACEPVALLRATSDGADGQTRPLDQQGVDAPQRCRQGAITDLSIFAYPGEPDTVMVTFQEDPRDTLSDDEGRRRQYWRRGDDGRWRILFDDTVRPRPEHLRGIPYSARSALD